MIYLICNPDNDVVLFADDMDNWDVETTSNPDRRNLVSKDRLTYSGFPLRYPLYTIDSVPNEVVNNYTYTTENGFVKIPQPEPEPTYEEEIEQAYRDRLAEEVSGFGYNA